jgi:hypothetical protein
MSDAALLFSGYDANVGFGVSQKGISYFMTNYALLQLETVLLSNAKHISMSMILKELETLLKRHHMKRFMLLQRVFSSG